MIGTGAAAAVLAYLFHRIEDRPVVVGGQIVIRPMNYLAMSYDHRIIDGKDAVLFLVDIKNQLENPGRMLFGL